MVFETMFDIMITQNVRLVNGEFSGGFRLISP